LDEKPQIQPQTQPQSQTLITIHKDPSEIKTKRSGDLEPKDSSDSDSEDEVFGNAKLRKLSYSGEGLKSSRSHKILTKDPLASSGASVRRSGSHPDLTCPKPTSQQETEEKLLSPDTNPPPPLLPIRFSLRDDKKYFKERLQSSPVLDDSLFRTPGKVIETPKSKNSITAIKIHRSNHPKEDSIKKLQGRTGSASISPSSASTSALATSASATSTVST